MKKNEGMNFIFNVSLFSATSPSRPPMSNLIKEERVVFFFLRVKIVLCFALHSAKQFGDVRFMDGCLYWLMFSVCLSAAAAICLCSGAMVINQHPLRIFITARGRGHLRGLFVLSQRARAALSHVSIYKTASYAHTLDWFLPHCTGAHILCLYTVASPSIHTNHH